MKKLVSLLLALVMCASLAACGGVDKQPAIDAQDRAAKAINEVSVLLNEHADSIEDFSGTFNQMCATLDEFGEMLVNDDMNQEQVDIIVKGCKEIEDWAVAAKAELEETFGG